MIIRFQKPFENKDKIIFISHVILADKDYTQYAKSNSQ
ncbi:hypothetical protein SDC9_56264 [bioreactor metagenome]|jgi:hypothetical protein|uniref:Uncharacterized protein n=1 Tax=bioreactor metagenome TaxID=1076179 RepID=A0A644X1C7_9ZZZZ